MAAYSKRHYGQAEWRLIDPRVIVEHYTVTATFAATFATFRSEEQHV